VRNTAVRIVNRGIDIATRCFRFTVGCTTGSVTGYMNTGGCANPSTDSSFFLQIPFLQILPTVAIIFFFRTDSTDFPVCLPIGPTFEHIRFFTF